MNKNKKTLKINKAFTLTEVLIATFISSLVMTFIFVFLFDTVEWIGNSKTEVKVLESIYSFSSDLNNYRNYYNTWSILIDTSTWSDVFLMETTSSEAEALLFWSVNLDTLKVSTGSNIYENKWIWFKKLSSNEKTLLETDPNNISSIQFYEDNVYSDIKVQNLSFVSYSSGQIFDLYMDIDLNFREELIWEERMGLPKDFLQKFNINF